jgi:hypothetical protein
MGDINPEIPIVNDLSDPGPIPDFLLRRAPVAPSSNLGCATHPSDLIKAGQQAWARVKSRSTWEDWKLIGAAIAEGRTRSMATAQTNQPKGSRYNKVFSSWLGVRGFDDLGKSTRVRLLQCMEHIDTIDDWLEQQKPDKRLRLNHPTTVLSAWKRATVEPKLKTEKPTSDWDLFFKRFTLREFLARMPDAWRQELLLRRDNLDKGKPDSKVTAAVKAALSHIASATDPKTSKPVAASNEHAALSNLRGVLRVLDGLDCSLHDIEIRLVNAKPRRRRAA